MPDTSCAIEDTLRLQAEAWDPDGDPLTYELAPVFSPGDLTQYVQCEIDTRSGAFWIRLLAAGESHRPFRLSVADGRGGTDSTTFTVRGWCENEPYDAPTLLGDLYRECFPRSAATDSSRVDARLYLDTINLPSNTGNRKLVLSSLPTSPGAGEDRLEFWFSGTLPETIDPAIRFREGWKVEVREADLSYCETCYNMCGLVPILLTSGPIDSVTFHYDPGDTLALYLRRLSPKSAQEPG